MKKKKKTFLEWRIIADASNGLGFDMMKCGKPERVGTHEVMENLDGLTMGQMLSLSTAAGGWNVIYDICRELMGMDEEEVNKTDAVQVVMFAGWAAGEIKRLNDMFGKIRRKETPEEKRAGIDRLDFGAFGLVDWYAKRMGIENHDDVMEVPCLRVYQCLKMDMEKDEYERRLSKIIREEK